MSGVLQILLAKSPPSSSSLSLNFATGVYNQNGTAYGSFASYLSATGSTFTRASANGTYIDNAGVLQTATTNAVRLNYDANYPRGNANPSLTGPFLLYEPAATNIALQSNNFAPGSWFATSSAVTTAAQFTSVDGTNDGWSMTNGPGGFGGVDQQITVSNVAYAMSVWAKTITGTPALTLKVNATSVAVSPATSATLKRSAVTITPAAGVNADNNIYGNTGTGQTAGIFGAQLETGAVATSYIVTTTTAQTRATDAFTIVVPAGLATLTVTFDDNSTQVIGSASGNYLLTTALTRPNVKSMVWS